MIHTDNTKQLPAVFLGEWYSVDKVLDCCEFNHP